METIKNYLESMFRNLPNTSEVLKAKAELLQMMEDKYTELRREGKSENEAVATVISEFGNLDELDIDVTSKGPEELQDISEKIILIIYHDQSVTIGDNNKIKDSTIASTIE